ncbi:MAG: DDE-type integrase/transposase/recombinase, partial [Gorillibacterium sp.]|nr:DDE-type integrase/transposase/recombinase [Gorillibacterium sp.]
MVRYAGNVLFCGQSVFALYVPSFRVSLISVGTLDRLGWDVKFGNGLATLQYNSSTFIGCLHHTSNIYWLNENDEQIALEPTAALSRSARRMKNTKLMKSMLNVRRSLRLKARAQLADKDEEYGPATNEGNEEPTVDRLSEIVSEDELSVQGGVDDGRNSMEGRNLLDRSLNKADPVHHSRKSYTELHQQSGESADHRPLGLKRRHKVSGDVWHKRLAHLNANMLSKLLKTHLLDGQRPSTLAEVENCETCIRAKFVQRMNRSKNAPRCKIPFQKVHADLCGPFKMMTIGRKKYYAVFTDDYSRLAKVYLLSSKSDINQAWRDFTAWVKARGWRINILRSDGGGEFQGLIPQLTDDGIEWEPSPPHTQHANGTAERMIRTLNTKTRCILMHGQVPTRFWGEAIVAVSMLHSFTPQASLNDRSPYEVLFGVKPSILHLRTFGCLVYRWVPPKTRQDKWSDYAVRGAMLGYAKNSKSIYQIWDFDTGTVRLSSNVTFREDLNA